MTHSNFDDEIFPRRDDNKFAAISVIVVVALILSIGIIIAHPMIIEKIDNQIKPC